MIEIRPRLVVVATAAIMLVACATGYGPQGYTGGYKEEQLDSSHFRVKFNGNGYASKERVWSFWIYRCAELTQQQGYTYFRLQDPNKPIADTNSGGKPIRPAVYRPSDNNGQLVHTKGGHFIYMPGGTYSITTWHTDAVVAMYKSPLPSNFYVIRAQTVLDDLAPYIQSDGKTTPVSREALLHHSITVDQLDYGWSFGGRL